MVPTYAYSKNTVSVQEKNKKMVGRISALDGSKGRIGKFVFYISIVRRAAYKVDNLS